MECFMLFYFQKIECTHPKDPSLTLRMTWKAASSLFVILSRKAKDLSAAEYAIVKR